MKKMQVETNITVTIGDQVITLTKSEAKSLYDSLGDALGEKTNTDIFKDLKPFIDKIEKDKNNDKWPNIPTYPIKPYEIWCRVDTSYSGVQANPESI